MATDKALYEDFMRLKTYTLVAEAHQLSRDSVRGRIWRYRQTLPPTPPLYPLPALTYAPRIYAPVVVIADVHIPTTDWTMLELARQFGEKHLPKGHRVLAIVGDLFNFDAVSVYPTTRPAVNLDVELETGLVVILDLFKTFDTILMCMGNHDQRLSRFLNGNMNVNHFKRLFTLSDQFKITDMRHMVVQHGSAIWRLTHQRNYSRIRGRLANTLAQKHQSNVVSHHEHHVAILRDEWNRYTVINNGALIDWERADYVVGADSNSPVMCSGFVYLNNGCGHLLTPYPTMTDWGMWDMEREALPAILAAETRRDRLTLPEAQKGMIIEDDATVAR